MKTKKLRITANSIESEALKQAQAALYDMANNLIIDLEHIGRRRESILLEILSKMFVAGFKHIPYIANIGQYYPNEGNVENEHRTRVETERNILKESSLPSDMQIKREQAEIKKIKEKLRVETEKIFSEFFDGKK